MIVDNKILLTNADDPNILGTNHVVSAKRGLPGPGEITEVPHYLASAAHARAHSAMSAKPLSSRIVTVEIFGRTYQFTSDDRDPEYVARAAKYLDEKMRQAAAAVGDRAPVDVAVLAAMEIAQEVLDARNQKAGLLDEADRRLDDVTRRISEKGEAPPPTPPRF